MFLIVFSPTIAFGEEARREECITKFGVSVVIWKVVALAFHHSFANFAEAISHCIKLSSEYKKKKSVLAFFPNDSMFLVQ